MIVKWNMYAGKGASRVKHVKHKLYNRSYSCVWTGVNIWTWKLNLRSTKQSRIEAWNKSETTPSIRVLRRVKPTSEWRTQNHRFAHCGLPTTARPAKSNETTVTPSLVEGGRRSTPYVFSDANNYVPKSCKPHFNDFTLCSSGIAS